MIVIGCQFEQRFSSFFDRHCIESPNCAKVGDGVIILHQLAGCYDEFWRGFKLGESAAEEPDVGVLDDFGKFFGGDVLEEVEVGFGRGAVGEAVDAAGGAVDAGVVVALAGV